MNKTIKYLVFAASAFLVIQFLVSLNYTGDMNLPIAEYHTQDQTSFLKAEEVIESQKPVAPKRDFDVPKPTVGKERDPIQNIKAITRVQNPFYVLGAYPEVTEAYQPLKFNKRSYGVIKEQDYCDRVDLYNLNNVSNIFEQKNFWTDFPNNQLPNKKVMSKTGQVVSEKHRAGKKWLPKTLDITINSFFMQYSIFHHFNKIGTNFNCATQMYNHIPGMNVLSNKDQVVDRINNYIKKYQDKPKCVNKKNLFPYTYRLYNKEECQDFFKMLSSDDYKKSLEKSAIQFVIKIGHGTHKSQGVFLFDQNKTEEIVTQYKNGSLCGTDNSPLLAQTYIANPLLFDNNNKFDFRIYMLIASTNPAIVYYHDGFIKLSLYEYQTNSSNRATHLTNTYLANEKISQLKSAKDTIMGMTKPELDKYILQDFIQLQEFLIKKGRINDTNWLDNYLRPEFHKALIHLIRMTSNAFWNQSNVYSLQGVDFMLDDDLKLWFIESNPSPLLSGTTKWRTYQNVVRSHFEIQFAYMRSRMKRALDVIQRMYQDIEAGGKVDYQKWKNEYKDAIKNRLEPEYQISKENTFQLVMDENLPGKEAYRGLIDECL